MSRSNVDKGDGVWWAGGVSCFFLRCQPRLQLRKRRVQLGLQQHLRQACLGAGAFSQHLDVMPAHGVQLGSLFG
jgi:hypothetical protein